VAKGPDYRGPEYKGGRVSLPRKVCFDNQISQDSWEFSAKLKSLSILK